MPGIWCLRHLDKRARRNLAFDVGGNTAHRLVEAIDLSVGAQSVDPLVVAPLYVFVVNHRLPHPRRPRP